MKVDIVYKRLYRVEPVYRSMLNVDVRRDSFSYNKRGRQECQLTCPATFATPTFSLAIAGGRPAPCHLGGRVDITV